MSPSIKALLVVLAIASITLRLVKPVALRFMSLEDFSRRRAVWLLLTVAGFLSPSIWWYAVVAVPALAWAARKDSNPVALYLLLLHVIPPVDVTIPVFGNHGLFALNNYRLLAFCVLLPAYLPHRRSRVNGIAGAFGAMDLLLLAFGALQVALYIPPDLPQHVLIPDSATNAVRRAILFLLDVYLLYFTVSRLCRSRDKLEEALASFCIACAVMAATALFERSRNWLLYVDIASRWGGDPNAAYYLVRGGSVRAQTSAGHSIALGNLLVVAFGFWLFLSTLVRQRMRRIGGTLLLWGGLFGAFSRGGWLGGAAVFFTFIAAGPRRASRLIKGACIAAAIAAVVLLSPLGDEILSLLPQNGQPADIYRYRLAQRGWALVFANPYFGNQFPWPELEDLRQGEGIIDMVNTYLGVALNYGFVGLSLFVGFIGLGMLRTYARAREFSRTDPELCLLGASLFASTTGVVIMIANTSFILGTEKVFFVLAGLSAAYARLDRSAPQRAPDPGQRLALE